MEPFFPDYMSENQLKQLLNLPSVVQRLQAKDYGTTKLYRENTPAKFFCLIIEGSMSVEVGKDGLIFESHSFSHFGSQTLLNTVGENSPEYTPDFNTWPATDCLVVIINQQQYKSSYDASKLEQKSFKLSNSRKVQSESIFAAESANCETADLREVSQSKRGGLASIGKYLARKSSRSKNGRSTNGELDLMNGYTDHQRLLSSSSNEDDQSDSPTDCHNINLGLYRPSSKSS